MAPHFEDLCPRKRPSDMQGSFWTRSTPHTEKASYIAI